MKFDRNGEWKVSTPYFAGSGFEVEEALKCCHKEWVWFSKDVRDGHLILAERCGSCVATRVRMRKLDVSESDP